jgi:hypothetical protein
MTENDIKNPNENPIEKGVDLETFEIENHQSSLQVGFDVKSLGGPTSGYIQAYRINVLDGSTSELLNIAEIQYSNQRIHKTYRSTTHEFEVGHHLYKFLTPTRPWITTHKLSIVIFDENMSEIHRMQISCPNVYQRPRDIVKRAPVKKPIKKRRVSIIESDEETEIDLDSDEFNDTPDAQNTQSTATSKMSGNQMPPLSKIESLRDSDNEDDFQIESYKVNDTPGVPGVLLPKITDIQLPKISEINVPNMPPSKLPPFDDFINTIEKISAEQIKQLDVEIAVHEHIIKNLQAKFAMHATALREANTKKRRLEKIMDRSVS